MKKGKSTGSKALVKELENAGTSVIFGYPGGATLPVYDELRSSSIRHILARHEQGAAHMADGYARVTGKTGVCMATSGPGATNLVTGIATAFMDSSPLLAITGQVSRPMIGNDAFQEVDITGITVPITKHNYLVQSAGEIPHTLQEAFYLASTGRKGPVLVDIPKDVQNEAFSTEGIKFPPLEGYNPTIDGHPGQMKKAVQLLEEAEKPLIIAGGGCVASGSEDILLELSEKADLPVASTLMGKTAFPNNHPRYFGMIGYHGRVAANTAVTEADVILAVGVRFGDRSTGNLSTFASKAKIIHIDIDPAEISKNVPAYLPIVGDTTRILAFIHEHLAPGSHPSWMSHLSTTRQEHPLRNPEGRFSIPGVLEMVNREIDNPILVTDVGRHQIFAAHYCDAVGKRSFITSGGLGTMGFGLPAAIGAKIGAPDRTVVLITGDGSFLMCCQEIATAVCVGVPVIVLVMNDAGLGMIQQLQDSFYGGRQVECCFPGGADFAALSRSLGGTGHTARNVEEASEALRTARDSDQFAVIDCILESREHTYPMVTGTSLMDYVE